MNLDQLGGQFDANKGPILATAAAGVVGFALYQRHKSSAAPAGPAQGVSTVSAGGQTAGMGGAAAYDSSASDVYGLVQPQLESLGNQLGDLKGRLDQIPLTQGPAPAPPAPPVVTPAPPPYAAPPTPPIPVSSGGVDTWVTVNAGDSLSKIAARFPQQSITWQSIYNANKSVIGGNANLIRAGQRLHVVG